MHKKYLILAILLIALVWVSMAVAAEADYATLNFTSRDANGTKVENVSVAVYEQLEDIDGNSILGSKLGSGTIKTLGTVAIKIKIGAGKTKDLVVIYNKGSKASEKHYLWDQSATAGSTATINLILSSVKVVLKNASGDLLKDLSYSLYTLTTDASGEDAADTVIYSSQKTGKLGYQTYYLVPAEYVLQINYPEVKGLENLQTTFTVSDEKQTDLTVTLSSVKITVRDGSGNIRKNSKFNLYQKETGDDDYAYLANFSTGSAGTRSIYLPAGYYKVEIQDYDGKYTKEYEFYLSAGQEKEITYDLGSFQLKLLDINKSAVPSRRVTITKQGGSKVFSGYTDGNGLVEVLLSSGTYNIEIEGIYFGTTYYLPNISFTQSRTLEMQYIMSKLRLKLQNQSTNPLINTGFTLYTLGTDAKGAPKEGTKIGTFSTDGKGEFEIYLPPDRYVITSADYKKQYISIEAQKLNIISLSMIPAVKPVVPTTPSSTTTTTTTPGTTVEVDSSPSDLYALDYDSDGLSNFEELYLYRTDFNKADTDGDGYNDSLEINNNYNAKGAGKLYYAKFSYEKPRVTSLGFEKELAATLDKKIKEKIGNFYISAENWFKYVNAYIYGGYSYSEIAASIQGKAKVHPSIRAQYWRTSKDYNK